MIQDRTYQAGQSVSFEWSASMRQQEACQKISRELVYAARRSYAENQNRARFDICAIWTRLFGLK